MAKSLEILSRDFFQQKFSEQILLEWLNFVERKTMNKVVRDGRVAVLYTSAHGAGWYSWHDIPELLFDPEVVRMIENPDEDEDENTIINYCREKYGTQGYYNGAKSLAIKWIPQGSQFRVQEYDGSETVIVASQEKWIQA